MDTYATNKVLPPQGKFGIYDVHISTQSEDVLKLLAYQKGNINLDTWKHIETHY